MSIIFAPAIVEVNPFGADLYTRDPEPIASVGHPADEVRDAIDWDLLADDAEMEAAWDLACEHGFGTW